jgi:hypothetical protein
MDIGMSALRYDVTVTFDVVIPRSHHLASSPLSSLVAMPSPFPIKL